MRIRLFITFLLCWAYGSVWADLGGFTYEKVTYEATVHKNNVWDVTETFYINFEEPRHGYYRYLKQRFVLHHDLPEKGLDSDGKPYTAECWYNLKIDNLSVDGGPIHDTKTENNYYIIQIGDADKTVVGNQKYVIHYTYTYPDDRLSDRDYIFHSILGDDFKEVIERFEFSVKFDKPLPQDAVDDMKVISGAYGGKDNTANVKMTVTPTEITGYADNIPPSHAVTLYSRFGNGYYEGVPVKSNTWFWIWFILAAASLAGIIVVALIIRRRPNFVKTIEFYPPDDISSAEVGVIIDDQVDDVDIASLIPWFASKGYIRIKESEDKKKSITLIKQKGLPKTAPDYQTQLWDLFFHNRKSICLDDIGEQPETMKDIKEALRDEFTEETGRAIQTTSMWAVLYLSWILFSTLAFTCNNVEDGDFWGDLFFAGLCWTLPAGLGLVLRMSGAGKDIITSSGWRIFFIVLKTLVMLFVCVMYVAVILPYGSAMTETMALVFWIVSFIAVEMYGCFCFDTEYRLKLIGKLLGFREFIETAEMPKLKALVDEDPEYFYRVLPYAQVFRLTTKWADLFKDIEMEKPKWYETSSSTDSLFFANSFAKTIESSTSSAISTISHVSSSDSGGGGGFSGGGGGGGGGGSW